MKKTLATFGLLVSLAMSAQTYTQEKLNILWPAVGDWKEANAQQTDKVLLEEFVHEKETLNNWTELGTNIVQKGVKSSILGNVARAMLEQAQKNNPTATFTPLQDDATGTLPWILFKIESTATKDKKAQAQLFYIVQGKMNLYISFFAVKKDKLSKQQIDKYSKFFRSCIMQYK